MRPLYDWCLKQAEKPYATWILFTISFLEASVFPIPPDVMLAPMVLARRDKAYLLAFVTTAGSIVGGLLGYAIGALAMATLGQWIVETYHLQHAFESFNEGFNKWGAGIILVKGLTPIPFKLVTIASGVAHFPLVPFVLACAATRAARFYGVAWVLRRYGETARAFLERYLDWIFLGLLAVIVLGFWLVLR
ncbi:MAG: YqaA family protein [Bdellovibrionales bacterium]